MRWYEVLKESSNNVTDQARETVLDILTPLLSMGVSSITLPQLVDQLETVPEFQGMDFTDDFMMDLFNGLDGFTVEPNDAGVMSVKINDNSQLHHSDSDKVKIDRGKEKVKQAAMNTIKKDMDKDSGL
jgi:hypothetical protein